MEIAELHPVRCEYRPVGIASAIKIAPPREMTAMTFSLLRANEKVLQKRRPSWLSIVRVNGTLRRAEKSSSAGRGRCGPGPVIWPRAVPLLAPGATRARPSTWEPARRELQTRLPNSHELPQPVSSF
jgi:hypothetical protein